MSTYAIIWSKIADILQFFENLGRFAFARILILYYPNHVRLPIFIADELKWDTTSTDQERERRLISTAAAMFRICNSRNQLQFTTSLSCHKKSCQTYYHYTKIIIIITPKNKLLFLFKIKRQNGSLTETAQVFEKSQNRIWLSPHGHGPPYPTPSQLPIIYTSTFLQHFHAQINSHFFL